MLSLNRSTERLWVVLVEDDDLLSGQLTNALERAVPEVLVQRTPDADVALAWLRDGRCRLLITEAQTASVDGVALATCARRQRPELPLIFLTDVCLAAESTHVADLGGSHLVDKPPRLDQFVDLVARVLEPASGFRGELSTSGVFELVQLAVMVAPSGALRLSGPEGAGAIWFENGSVVHAVLGRERGVLAFQHMLGWRSGQFSIDACARAPERSVTANTMALLLNAARVLDEAADARARGHEFEPPDVALVADAVLPASPADQASGPRPKRESHVAIRAVRAPDGRREQAADQQGSAAALFERGLKAVWDKNYADALPQWERAAQLEPDNRRYQHNLRRLRQLIDSEPRARAREVTHEYQDSGSE